MKVPTKILLALIIIIIVALLWLNFFYLPRKIESAGPAFLEKKTRGKIQAASIQYIPFTGIKSEQISILSDQQKVIYTIDKLYLNISLWPLIVRGDLDFRLDIYLPATKKPLILKGLYQNKFKVLNLDCQLSSELLRHKQVITAKATVIIDPREKTSLTLAANSSDLDIQGRLYIQAEDLHIEKLSAKILNSTLELIGQVQHLNRPELNIYGNCRLDLADLHNLNPQFSRYLEKVQLAGQCLGEILISEQPNNPVIGLKMHGDQIMVNRSEVARLSIISKLKNKQLSLSKFYAQLCAGEINLEGSCRLDAPGLPYGLNINIFNLDLSRVVREITEKDIPLQGRLFSLARLEGRLQEAQDIEGKLWVSASGTNILQLPQLEGLAEILRIPKLREARFKEASGNFIIADRTISTSDFKITSNAIDIGIKGTMDFKGDVNFDILPVFAPGFISGESDIGNILGILVDPTGNFLGEIKMKGNINDLRYTFKPIAVEKIIPRGIEEGLRQLFKFKKKEE